MDGSTIYASPICVLPSFFTCFIRLTFIWAFTSSTSSLPLECKHPQFSSIQSFSRIWLFATPWTAARQSSLSITNSQSLLKLMSVKSVMPSNHLILCCPLLFLPSVFPNIRVCSYESVLRIRWPTYWSFSFSISPSYEYSGLISFRIGRFPQGRLFVFSVLWSNPSIHNILAHTKCSAKSHWGNEWTNTASKAFKRIM